MGLFSFLRTEAEEVIADLEGFASKVRAELGANPQLAAAAENYLAGMVAEVQTRLKGLPIADMVVGQVAAKLGVQPAAPVPAPPPAAPPVVAPAPVPVQKPA